MSMLKAVVSIMSPWGNQNILQVVVFTDCGLGFGNTSIISFLEAYADKETEPEFNFLKTLANYNLNFICLGLHGDHYFTRGLAVYQQLLDKVSLKGEIDTYTIYKSLMSWFIFQDSCS